MAGSDTGTGATAAAGGQKPAVAQGQGAQPAPSAATKPQTNDGLGLHTLLKAMLEKDASDLHLSMGTPPQLRIDGKLLPLNLPPLTPLDTKRLCYSVLTDAQKRGFEEESELDFSFGIKNLSRFRANFFLQRGAVAAVFRRIPYAVLDAKDLGLPATVLDIVRKPRGLVLFTGPTGSGKSTTLAALVDQINRERHAHIMTIEDPIEYVHTSKRSLINQREIGADTQSFKKALKYVLRQDPDVVLIGEMRDLETIEAALTISETGHLALATLHTNSTIQTINRIVDVFPPYQQTQVRVQLANVLEGIACQQLVPKIGGGRALAMELMIPNQAIRNLIREDKMHQVYSQIQTGRNKHGMQTMNQSLADLVSRGIVDAEVALNTTSDPEELRGLISAGKVL